MPDEPAGRNRTTRIQLSDINADRVPSGSGMLNIVAAKVAQNNVGGSQQLAARTWLESWMSVGPNVRLNVLFLGIGRSDGRLLVDRCLVEGVCERDDDSTDGGAVAEEVIGHGVVGLLIVDDRLDDRRLEVL